MLAVLATALLPAVAWAHHDAAAKRPEGRGSPVTGDRSRPAGGPRAYASIVGGRFARAGQFPWLARVLARRGRVLDACSGTVVARDVILTAGHCVEDVQTGTPYAATEFQVHMSANSAGQLSSARVFRVLVYPGFERSSGVGDVALLELSTPVAAPPIPLAGEGEAWPSGTRALMAGWGRDGAAAPTQLLRWANTVVQSPEWCAQRLRGFHVRRQMCVMNSPRDNTAGCIGDSGGPLLVKRGQATVEIGVLDGSVVRGSKVLTCLTTEPTVYANSSVISRWVHEWIQRLTSVPIAVTEDGSTIAPRAPAASPPAMP
jgi:secreted trypsin-like serine protease